MEFKGHINDSEYINSVNAKDLRLTPLTLYNSRLSTQTFQPIYVNGVNQRIKKVNAVNPRHVKVVYKPIHFLQISSNLQKLILDRNTITEILKLRSNRNKVNRVT